MCAILILYGFPLRCLIIHVILHMCLNLIEKRTFIRFDEGIVFLFHFLCCLITWRRYHGINGLESGFDRVTRILMVLNVTWLVNKTHTQDKKETFEHTVKIIIYHISYIDIYHILYIIRRYISGSWSGCIVWLSQRRLLRRGTDVSKAGVQMGWGG